ncbi:MAG: hypothetical protein AB1746_17480, partial [Candidatus Zixiibacteriota bacterium]
GVFGFLTRKTDWLIPLLIAAVVGSTLGHFIRPIYILDREKVAMERIEKYRDQIPTDRYNQIIENMSEQFAKAKANKYVWYIPLLAIALPFVFFAIITVIGLLTGNFVFGGKAGFWIVMNVVAFASLVGLLGDIVRMVLMLAKDSSYVYTGLGMLKPIDDGSFMYYLFSQIDVFSIWRIAVTCIGLGIIYKMKPSKFAYVLFTVWIIFIAAVALGNSTIFMGGIVY